jgi:hypothetical protein
VWLNGLNSSARYHYDKELNRKIVQSSVIHAPYISFDKIFPSHASFDILESPSPENFLGCFKYFYKTILVFFIYLNKHSYRF